MVIIFKKLKIKKKESNEVDIKNQRRKVGWFGRKNKI